MKRISQFCFLLCALLLLTACNSKPEPLTVAEQFWAAMEQGDIDTAKTVATPESERSLRWQAKRSVSNITLGELRYEEELALVATSLTVGQESTDEKNTDSDYEPLVIQFDTVLKQHNGEWRIDFNDTAGAMIAVSLDELGTELKESMKEMGSALGEVFNEAMDDAAQGISEALQQAAEEMRRAAEELRKERERMEQEGQEAGSGREV